MMDLTSSQEVSRVDDDLDPEVILEFDPCGNLVIACNAVSGEAAKDGEKYATFLQATLGAPGYFPCGVGSATHTREVPYITREHTLMSALVKKVLVSLKYYVIL